MAAVCDSSSATAEKSGPGQGLADRTGICTKYWPTRLSRIIMRFPRQGLGPHPRLRQCCKCKIRPPGAPAPRVPRTAWGRLARLVRGRGRADGCALSCLRPGGAERSPALRAVPCGPQAALHRSDTGAVGIRGSLRGRPVSPALGRPPLRQRRGRSAHRRRPEPRRGGGCGEGRPRRECRQKILARAPLCRHRTREPSGRRAARGRGRPSPTAATSPRPATRAGAFATGTDGGRGARRSLTAR